MSNEIKFNLIARKPAKSILVANLHKDQLSASYIESVAYEVGMWSLRRLRLDPTPEVFEALLVEEDFFKPTKVSGMVETVMFVGVAKWLQENTGQIALDQFQIGNDLNQLRVFAETMGHLLTKGMAFYDNFFFVDPTTGKFDLSFQDYWNQLVK